MLLETNNFSFHEKKKMKIRFYQVFLVSLLLFLIIQINLYLEIEKQTIQIFNVNRIFEKPTCICRTKEKVLALQRQFSVYIQSNFLSERNILKSDGSNKLGYCQKRLNSLHYNYKDALDSLLNSNEKIMIAIMLHQNEESFHNWFSEFQKLMLLLKPISPYISILESDSSDLTPMW